MRYFFFGTLRDADILAAVLGRTIAPGLGARLEGYRLAPVLGEQYPTLVAASAEQVEGTIAEGLDTSDAAKLAFFEGDEYFASPHTVLTSADARLSALVFIARAPLAIGTENWDFSTWLLDHKADFLAHTRRWMAHYPTGAPAEAERDWSRAVAT